MERVIRDGMVAVLYSPGFGAGWSTWGRGDNEEAMVFDPGLVDLVSRDAGDDEILAYAEAKFPEEYLGGLDRISVEWVPVGSKFRIDEYDGNESVVLLDNERWLVA